MSVNASPSWPYPGARWWKFDFHTHTPASKDTGAWQVAIGTPNELTPQTWLLKYMAAEIDCVAVTDHNTGEWIDRLKAAYAEMKREADDIANLAFIGGKTNRAISDKAPVTYLLPLVAQHGAAPFAAQCIPVEEELLALDHYKAFLQERRKRIAAALNAFIHATA